MTSAKRIVLFECKKSTPTSSILFTTPTYFQLIFSFLSLHENVKCLLVLSKIIFNHYYC